ncbi:MAG: methylated-DNA--[protein]-cysteine S-methyltransferase [Bacteroidia bacterium]|nr:methylated-DNA--[protein]-cysteine S-methyltransferase [Bacteroidia bacterium]
MQTIIYHQSPVGLLKIKTDFNFVSAVLFCDATDVIPASNSAGTAALTCVRQLDEYFEGKRTAFDFPMKQMGSDFQQKIWNELLKIPYGETITYLELSKRVGDTKAVRACGTANGQNQLAVVVPCHRVIGSNGKLVGYSGQLWRKKWLLLHEANNSIPTKTLF